MRRGESFHVHNCKLIRVVDPPYGTTYIHSCRMDLYEELAHRMEELGTTEAGFTLETLIAHEHEHHGRAIRIPVSQAAVALAFLKERGVVTTFRRRCYAEAGCHLDAMTEYHALRAEAGHART